MLAYKYFFYKRILLFVNKTKTQKPSLKAHCNLNCSRKSLIPGKSKTDFITTFNKRGWNEGRMMMRN